MFPKDRQLNCRVLPEEKDLILAAMRKKGITSIQNFLRSSSLPEAQRIVCEEEEHDSRHSRKRTTQLNIRVSNSDLSLLRAAAIMTGNVGASSFVRQLAINRAKTILGECKKDGA